MNQTTTGIVVALAVAVVAVFFIFPGLSPFSSSTAAPQSTTVGTDTGATTNQASTTTTTMDTNPTQLEVADEVVGTGAVAQAGDSVTVNYVGSLTNGTVFDASANHGSAGFTFTLGAGQVIQGWDQGIVGMKVGGTRKLIIPAALAYGAQSPSPAIPPNSVLVFEVQLTGVQAPK